MRSRRRPQRRRKRSRRKRKRRSGIRDKMRRRKKRIRMRRKRRKRINAHRGWGFHSAGDRLGGEMDLNMRCGEVKNRRCPSSVK